jgi:hypothetical protein
MKAEEARQLSEQADKFEFIFARIEKYAKLGYRKIVCPYKLSTEDDKKLTDMGYTVGAWGGEFLISW